MSVNKTPPLPGIRGVLAPVVTPFKNDLEPDADAFLEHCQWLLRNEVSLAVFGTNSEATSLSLDERIGLTEHLLEAGVPARRLMPGTGCCALPDTVRLTRHAVQAGAAGVLVLPPFYYKGVSDEGLFRYFSEVIERVADDRLRMYLYHFPAMSAVPLSLTLIERLLARYPGIVAGMKDSTGDWASARAYIEAFGKDGFDVFPGSELLLLEGMRAGAAGCISATANVNPDGIYAVYNQWDADGADALNRKMSEIRKTFQRHPMIAAMKHVIAQHRGQPSWRNVRPPLTALSSTAAGELAQQLEKIDYQWSRT